MSGYRQPREGGGNMRRLEGWCWWKITRTQGKGKRNLIQLCHVLSCIWLYCLQHCGKYNVGGALALDNKAKGKYTVNGKINDVLFLYLFALCTSLCTLHSVCTAHPWRRMEDGWGGAGQGRYIDKSFASPSSLFSWRKAYKIFINRYCRYWYF